ncbi:MAG: hypothetical protein ACQESR_09690 [Planctomycetota bacterium]
MRLKRMITVCAMVAIASGFNAFTRSSAALGQESNPPVTPFNDVDKKPASKVKKPASKVKKPAPKVKKAAPKAKRLRAARPKVVKQETGRSPRLKRAREISKALDHEIMLDFDDAPLSEIVDYLETLREIPVVIDHRALDNVGLGPDTPISCGLKGISLRSALALLLSRLDLDYVIHHEVLMITTEEAARSHLDPRLYLIEDLNPDRLVELITDVIAPETWQEVGGTGTITALEGGLVIAQTDQIHAQIADFIQTLRPVAGQLLAPRSKSERKRAPQDR